MYKAILLPVDLAHESSWSKAARVAARLADAFGAELHVATVVPDVRAGLVSQFFPGDFEKRAIDQTAKELSVFCRTQFTDRAVKEHVGVGPIYRQIAALAGTHGCDLIVMASHRPELTDILLGPNADQVVRSTPASVFIVRT